MEADWKHGLLSFSFDIQQVNTLERERSKSLMNYYTQMWIEIGHQKIGQSQNPYFCFASNFSCLTRYTKQLAQLEYQYIELILPIWPPNTPSFLEQLILDPVFILRSVLSTFPRYLTILHSEAEAREDLTGIKKPWDRDCSTYWHSRPVHSAPYWMKTKRNLSVQALRPRWYASNSRVLEYGNQ